MTPVDQIEDPQGLVYRVPRLHAIRDWTVVILATLMLSGFVLGVVGGVLIGALGVSPLFAYVAVPASISIAAWCVLRFARGEVGREWRLGVRGIERGTGWFHRCVPYERVRVIMMGAPGVPSGRAHQLAVNRVLTVRLDRGVLSIYLKKTDLLDCFESLRQLCPHAGAIDIEGKSVGPMSARVEDRNDPPLAKEWRRRGWQGLGFILLRPFLDMLLVMGALAAFPGASSHDVIRRVVVSLALVAIGVAGAVIRAFREARRCRGAAGRGNDQQP